MQELKLHDDCSGPALKIVKRQLFSLWKSWTALCQRARGATKSIVTTHPKKKKKKKNTFIIGKRITLKSASRVT